VSRPNDSDAPPLDFAELPSGSQSPASATDRFANRSEIVRAGLQRIVAEDAAQTIDRAFAEGFTRHPDSDEDIRRTTRLAIESIEDEPWEKWW